MLKTWAMWAEILRKLVFHLLLVALAEERHFNKLPENRLWKRLHEQRTSTYYVQGQKPGHRLIDSGSGTCRIYSCCIRILASNRPSNNPICGQHWRIAFRWHLQRLHNRFRLLDPAFHSSALVAKALGLDRHHRRLALCYRCWFFDSARYAKRSRNPKVCLLWRNYLQHSSHILLSSISR